MQDEKKTKMTGKIYDETIDFPSEGQRGYDVTTMCGTKRKLSLNLTHQKNPEWQESELVCNAEPCVSGNSSTSSKKRKLRWDENKHKRFLATLFDIGLKSATPKLIQEYWVQNYKEQQDSVTISHIKSHLQKYRLNSQKARKLFLTQVNAAHEEAKAGVGVGRQAYLHAYPVPAFGGPRLSESELATSDDNENGWGIEDSTRPAAPPQTSSHHPSSSSKVYYGGIPNNSQHQGRFPKQVSETQHNHLELDSEALLTFLHDEPCCEDESYKRLKSLETMISEISWAVQDLKNRVGRPQGPSSHRQPGGTK